jgi:hypothetical protein
MESIFFLAVERFGKFQSQSFFAHGSNAAKKISVPYTLLSKSFS